jgi:hypothetical protein
MQAKIIKVRSKAPRISIAELFTTGTCSTSTKIPLLYCMVAYYLS